MVEQSLRYAENGNCLFIVIALKEIGIEPSYIILRYLINRVGAVHQNMYPASVPFFKHPCLENILQTCLFALVGAAVIEKT